LLVLPCLSQGNSDREVARTQDYIAAATKKGVEKINALKAYIKKFPEKSSRWTKLAYYQLAIGYYEVKNYAEAVKWGEQRLGMGGFGAGEEGRLALVVANSYGIKSASIFNKEKALKFTNKAIALAKKDKDNKVLSTAQSLKKSLSGPAPKKMSPEQKIKMHYSNEEYSEAISYYKTLGAADKGNFEIHHTYAKSLFKANSLDSALNEFKALYAKEKKGAIAVRMGDIYNQKAKRNRALYENAATYYVHAGYLYSKEGSSTNSKVAFQKAEAALGDKYNFNKKVRDLEAKQRRNQASAKQNEQLIRNKGRELRKLKREHYKKYEAIGMAPPPHEEAKVKKLEDEIAALKSGMSASDAGEANKLMEEKAKIQKELQALKAKVKKELGL
jgi:hypothetical protein